MRPTIQIGILLLWGAALVALFRHDLRPEGQQGAPPADRLLADSDIEEGEWWGVYLQGHKVGYVHHVLAESHDAVLFRQESVLVLTTLGVKQRIQTQASGEMAGSFALRHMEFNLIAGPTRLEVKAVGRGDAVHVTMSSSRERVDLAPPLSLPLGLRAAAMKAPLEVGREVRGHVFDPMTATSSLLELRVGERGPLPGHPERSAWRISETWRDVKSVLWVDESGRLLREEGPMGLVAVRESKEDAQRLASVGSEWDAIDAVALPVDPPVTDPRTRKTFRLRIFGTPLERIPTGDGQSVDDLGVLITKADLDQVISYALPYAGSDHADELAPTASLQVDHPRIRALAKDIVGNERDALSATHLLVEWVFHYLSKIPTASLPNALEILDTGQGDCNEHAVLLTALARSAGIPARVASGLVYGDGAFLYHAWTDVWIGRWVPVDAAMNQVPADATHVRLTIGDRDQQVRMMGMLGNLSIEIAK